MIIITTETANYIMGHAHSAFVSTRSVSDMEDTLICDGGATCTLTKTLENCTQCKPKVVDIQTLKHVTCDTHVKCLSCMIGKAILEDLPKAKKVITKPLYQIHMDSFSSSVRSIEGYFHAHLY